MPNLPIQSVRCALKPVQCAYGPSPHIFVLIPQPKNRYYRFSVIRKAPTQPKLAPLGYRLAGHQHKRLKMVGPLRGGFRISKNKHKTSSISELGLSTPQIHTKFACKRVITFLLSIVQHVACWKSVSELTAIRCQQKNHTKFIACDRICRAKLNEYIL